MVCGVIPARVEVCDRLWVCVCGCVGRGGHFILNDCDLCLPIASGQVAGDAMPPPPPSGLPSLDGRSAAAKLEAPLLPQGSGSIIEQRDQRAVRPPRAPSLGLASFLGWDEDQTKPAEPSIPPQSVGPPGQALDHPRRLRCLFLHGFASDACLQREVMKATGWADSGIDFIFIDAPHPSAARPDLFEALHNAGLYDEYHEFREWGFGRADAASCVAASLELIEAALREHTPVHALAGVCDGALAAALGVSQLERRALDESLDQVPGSTPGDSNQGAVLVTRSRCAGCFAFKSCLV